jgi:hypothetical protein
MKSVAFAIVLLIQIAFPSFAQLSFEDDEDLDTEQLKSDLLNLQDKTEDLNADIRKLRHTADMYEREDYELKLKKLQREAEDLSAEAIDFDATEAADSLDDSALQLKRARREIEFEPRIFYTERDDYLDHRLRKSALFVEDAATAIEDKSFEIEDSDIE